MEAKRIFNCPTETLEEFERAAKTAAALGYTHMTVSDLPKSIWQWDRDRFDPYPNWGMMHAALFKVYVPEKLRKYLPCDYAEKNLQIVADRCKILKKYGLKAAFHGCEPAWLPEEVYRAHPDWRGGRCDHPRRARKAYFSPCIDNEEVLAMYREAVAAICRVAPIENFTFMTNDSGGGICWGIYLYPGQNGPAACAHISFKDRITKFLSTLQAGAADAGLCADVAINGPKPLEAASAIPYLADGQYINGQGRESATNYMGCGLSDYFYSCNFFPVKGLQQPVSFARGYASVEANPERNCTVSLERVDNDICLAIMELAEGGENETPAKLWGLLEKVAKKVASYAPEHLLRAWEAIDRAITQIAHLEAGGPILMLGCLNQRWLNRPFVPFPMELTEEEKSWWRPFIFQANSEETACDLMNLQCYPLVRGHSGKYIAVHLIEGAVRDLANAENCYRAAAKAGDAERWNLEADRMHACILLCRNAVNACRFQEILDRTDYSLGPCENDVWHTAPDERLRDMQVIFRNELDNTEEMAKLLEGRESDIFYVAERPEDEDIFLFGPNLVAQLRKKQNVMMDHYLELQRLWARHN
ncbi:MAG: hypothetical protein IKT60_00760 [Clostridia bacterium]|nr:hypothetical protein [Clostridia bacterium]